MSKAEKTKQFIIKQTATLFNVKGFAGTSLSDMTDVTGLTKGSIYGNFENKDEVALAAFDYNLEQVNLIIEREIGKASGPREKLMAYVRVYSDPRAFDFPTGGCPVQNTAIEADDTHPALRVKAAKAILGWKQRIESIIDSGRAGGTFRKYTDAHQAALTIIAMIEGSQMISNATGKQEFRHSIMASLRDYIDKL